MDNVGSNFGKQCSSGVFFPSALVIQLQVLILIMAGAEPDSLAVGCVTTPEPGDWELPE